MILPVAPGVFAVRHGFVWSYLLVDESGVVAIDTGMGGSARRIQQWFARSGREPSDLKAILLTHGHLDHAGGAEKLRAWSGASIHLHPADWSITQGKHPYRGVTRVTGFLERMGRPLFRYHKPSITRELAADQQLDLWGGLQVLHLPGHTPGHVGFYSPTRKLLFSGDTIIVTRHRCGLPLRVLNIDHEEARSSVVRLAGLDADWVFPAHHRGLSHNLMREINAIAARIESRRQPTQKSAPEALAEPILINPTTSG